MIRAAHPHEIRLLPQIENAADARYARVGLKRVVDMPAHSIASLEQGRRRGLLWVAVSPRGQVVGFALMEIKGGLMCSTGNLDEWNALYQQRPKPAESGEVSASWFERHENNKLSQDQQYLSIVSWDTAGTANERSDYTVGLACKMGLKDRKFYITDMYREKKEFHALMREIPAFNAKHEAQAILLENKGTGTSLIQVLRTSGQNIIPVQPQKQGSKEFRFELAIPALEAKRVSLPRGAAWVSTFEEELLTFPGSNHDDIVDAFSQLVNHYAQRGTSRGMRALKGY